MLCSDTSSIRIFDEVKVGGVLAQLCKRTTILLEDVKCCSHKLQHMG